MKKRRVELVHDWRFAWKWISVQLSVLGVVAAFLWDYVPVLQSPRATMILFLLIGVGRLIKQGAHERNGK